MKVTPAFAGRVAELQFLFQCLGKAVHGQRQVVFLQGAAGIGKSALLQMFGIRAAHRQKTSYVFYIRPPETGRYAPLAQAALEATNKQLYDRVGGRRKSIEAARDLLPDWLGAIPGIGDLMAAIVATTQVVRRRRQGQTSTRSITLTDDTEALLAVARRRPLVLLLDDLQDADDTAITDLERLIRAAGDGTKLQVVGAYRQPPPGVPEPPIRRLIATLPEALVRHRQLKELDKQELGFWLQKRFPHIVIPDSFLRWLFENTGGHAWTVESLLNRLTDRSVIRFVDRHWEIREDPEQQNSAVHTASADSLKVDLSAIRPEVLAVLRGASILGDEFDGSRLALMLGRDELYVEDQLALAAHHKIVEITGETTLPDGEIANRFRFTSSHLRAVLARDLSAEDRAAFAHSEEALSSST